MNLQRMSVMSVIVLGPSVFKSGHVLQTDNETAVRKFYAAANAMCSHVKFASEMSVLFLMETFCLPLLSYFMCSS